jgi:hypothetical protein
MKELPDVLVTLHKGNLDRFLDDCDGWIAAQVLWDKSMSLPRPAVVFCGDPGKGYFSIGRDKGLSKITISQEGVMEIMEKDFVLGTYRHKGSSYEVKVADRGNPLNSP